MLSGDAGKVEEIIGESCGDPDCSIHGDKGVLVALRKRNPDLIDDDMLTGMTHNDMREMALGATAGAHNALVRKEYKRAGLLQHQAKLWFVAAEAEREAFERMDDAPDTSASESGE
jgi:hypothetical protein